MVARVSSSRGTARFVEFWVNVRGVALTAYHRMRLIFVHETLDLLQRQGSQIIDVTTSGHEHEVEDPELDAPIQATLLRVVRTTTNHHEDPPKQTFIARELQSFRPSRLTIQRNPQTAGPVTEPSVPTIVFSKTVSPTPPKSDPA
ncbi:hypothetical protein E4U28_005946 [Claviceps purpurea]|nr:hypothetical protein E4U28_005946 [Claviceps purpurea]